ncbi:hypothetical protein TIFTF001_038493 [Ficus carica]|uniref:Uncharacterized protein n=1 Tax=Ficus carica TaxID=3494 RepID=A0AA88E7V1_FICCA|nr:hypothetical protein TIFTF001_038493 [Ficus carica]
MPTIAIPMVLRRKVARSGRSASMPKATVGTAGDPTIWVGRQPAERTKLAILLGILAIRDDAGAIFDGDDNDSVDGDKHGPPSMRLKSGNFEGGLSGTTAQGQPLGAVAPAWAAVVAQQCCGAARRQPGVLLRQWPGL